MPEQPEIYYSLCVGLTVCTTDRMMSVFTIFNCLHFCEINSYIFVISSFRDIQPSLGVL